MKKNNPWHDVSIGNELPNIVQAIIEISQRSKAKYELDKQSGLLRLDRVLYSAVHYPVNYGFIPQTLGEDRDPLDIFVFSQIKIEPLCIVRAKIIGVMRMIDNGEADDKIIAVAEDDMSVAHINSVDELPIHLKTELKNFFEDYKKLENKSVEVKEFQEKKVAVEILRKAINDYNHQFKEDLMPTYKKILIAVDGSEYSMTAARKGLEFSHQLNAVAGLTFVIDNSKALANPDLGTTAEQVKMVLKKEAEQTLDQLADMYNGKELKKFMPEGNPVYKEIIKLAETWKADLIVMGTHGRTGLQHLLMGSVAEHVMRHSDIPVMVVSTKSKN